MNGHSLSLNRLKNDALDANSAKENKYLLTPVHWDYKNKIARFWMAEERVKKMKEGNWYVMPVRVDEWNVIGEPTSVNKIVL